MGKGGVKVVIPQEKLGKGVPEAAPAVLRLGPWGGDTLAGAGVLGDVLQVPPLGVESCG